MPWTKSLRFRNKFTLTPNPQPKSTNYLTKAKIERESSVAESKKFLLPSLLYLIPKTPTQLILS